MDENIRLTLEAFDQKNTDAFEQKSEFCENIFNWNRMAAKFYSLFISF